MSTEPIHIISLGAGVQSSTMSLMAACGDITPMPKCAIFADTQTEPASVYRWLDWLEKQLPFPVIRVSAGNLRDDILTPYWSNKNKKQTFESIPAYILNDDGTSGIMERQCTKDFKIDPVSKSITVQMREYNTHSAVKWLGISVDEVWRAKPSRRKSVEHRWPLLMELRFSRQDCLVWMKSHGFPRPPRSACTFCPYRGKDEWLSLSKEEFEDAVDFEKKFQAMCRNTNLKGTPFFHRSLKPLSEVDFSTEEEWGQLNMFNNECEGMCGV